MSMLVFQGKILDNDWLKKVVYLFNFIRFDIMQQKFYKNH